MDTSLVVVRSFTTRGTSLVDAKAHQKISAPMANLLRRSCRTPRHTTPLNGGSLPFYWFIRNFHETKQPADNECEPRADLGPSLVQLTHTSAPLATSRELRKGHQRFALGSTLPSARSPRCAVSTSGPPRMPRSARRYEGNRRIPLRKSRYDFHRLYHMCTYLLWKSAFSYLMLKNAI